MLRLVVLVLVVVVAFVGYSRLTAPSAHDRAVASLKRSLSETNTAYRGVTCTSASANTFAQEAFGSGVQVFDCRVGEANGMKAVCVAVGGNLQSNQSGLQDTTCSEFGTSPALNGLTGLAGSS
jgi:hypothetical protein